MTSKNKKKKGKKKESNNLIYEKVVSRIYELFSENSVVKHDERVIGIESKVERQIDVSIRTNIAGHDIFVIVECKNVGRQCTLQHVDSFIGMIRDVGANKGIIVSKNGFSKPAITRAKAVGIDLCQIHDSETNDWKLEIKEIPVVIERFTPFISINFKFSLDIGEVLTSRLAEVTVSGRNIWNNFKEKWNNLKIELEEKEFQFSHGISKPYLIELKDKKKEIKELNVNINIKKEIYFGYLHDLPSLKALKNLTSGLINATFKVQDIDSVKIDGFLKIEKIDDIPVKVSKHLKILESPILLDKHIKNSTVKIEKA